jgi:3-deoxy-D-manno-octulosonic-acid transferase
MGELKMFYGLSEVALLGGTWSRVGGHNPLEAAAYGIPILSGPHLHKIHDLAVNLKEMGMFFEVPDRSAVIAKLREVLRDWEPVTFPEHWGVADRLAQEISEKLRA